MCYSLHFSKYSTKWRTNNSSAMIWDSVNLKCIEATLSTIKKFRYLWRVQESEVDEWISDKVPGGEVKYIILQRRRDNEKLSVVLHGKCLCSFVSTLESKPIRLFHQRRKMQQMFIHELRCWSALYTERGRSNCQININTVSRSGKKNSSTLT